MRWKEGSKPEIPAERLELLKKLKDGKVSFEAFQSQEYFTVIGGMADLAEGIPKELKNSIINRSIFSACKKGVITRETIKREIISEEKGYLKKPINSYILVSSLSISGAVALPAMRVNGSTISFPAVLHQKYRAERRELVRQASEWVFRNRPRNYLNVTVRVKARSESEAVNLALDQLDLIRGIWNMKNTGMMRMSSGRIKPVNNILLGPVHTLHLPSKNLATDTFWYQENYHDDISPLQLSNRKEATLSLTNRVRGRLKLLPYREVIEEAIRRYARALDYSDLEAAFLKLWSVLELLTNTTLKDNFKVTVRRASFVHKDNESHHQILNTLRIFRNAAVHSSADSSGQIESFLYLLKRYVEQLIRFHLWIRVKFPSFAEAASFLDSKPDVKELKKQHKLIGEAIRYRTG